MTSPSPVDSLGPGPLTTPPEYMNHPVTTLPRNSSTCPHGCQNTTFRGAYEHNRHMKEQHRCPYEACLGPTFQTPESQKEHVEQVHGGVFPYRCGPCALEGTPKTYKRGEKLNNHFKDAHAASAHQIRTALLCKDPSCSTTKGGISFLSEDQLKRHHQCEHAVQFSEQACMPDLIDRKYISER
jgi:hypothetical protein